MLFIQNVSSRHCLLCFNRTYGRFVSALRMHGKNDSFFCHSTGHFQYAKSAHLWCLQDMCQLQKHTHHEEFKNLIRISAVRRLHIALATGTNAIRSSTWWTEKIRKRSAKNETQSKFWTVMGEKMFRVVSDFAISPRMSTVQTDDERAKNDVHCATYSYRDWTFPGPLQ